MKSYQKRLFLGMVAFIVVPILVSGFVSYKAGAAIVERKYGSELVRLLQSSDLNIRTVLHEFEGFSNSAIVTSELQRYLRLANAEEEPPLLERQNLARAAQRVLVGNPWVVGVALYAKGDLLMSVGAAAPPRAFSSIDSVVRERLEKNGGRPVWFGPGEAAGVVDEMSSPALVHAQLVKDYDTLADIGQLFLLVKGDLIDQLIKELYNAQSESMMIVDGSGRVMFSHPEENFVNDSLATLPVEPRASSGYFVDTIGGSKQLVTYRESDVGWTLVLTKEWATLTRELALLRNSVIIGVLVGVVLALLFNLLYVRRLSAFVDEFSSAMVRAQEGALDTTMNTRYPGDLSSLARGFNGMLQRISRLMSEVKEEHRRKQDAEFRVLQAQIKPHFLYNTLESISSLAATSGNGRIQAITLSLAKLLRISISPSQRVPLSQELEHVRSYLEIQQVRYANRFTFEISVDRDLSDVTVLKLLLQPLVENALYHGFEATKRRGHISIRGTSHGEDGLITVSDNGSGIPIGVARALNGLGYERCSVQLGHGLRNVCERLKMYYGPHYGLFVCVGSETGTQVRIRFPKEDVAGYDTVATR